MVPFFSMREDFSRSLQALSLSTCFHANTAAFNSSAAATINLTSKPWVDDDGHHANLDVGCDHPSSDDVYESCAKVRRGARGEGIALDEEGSSSSSRLRRSPVPASSTEGRVIEPPHPRIAALRAAANIECREPDSPLLQVVVAEPRSGLLRRLSKELPDEPAKSVVPSACTPPANAKSFREADFIASRTRGAMSRTSTSPLGEQTSDRRIEIQ